MLETQDLFKTYFLGKDVQVPALRGVSVTVKRGAFTAIMGPSGSGKSTLMNIIGCLDQPTKGTITIEGIETSRMSRSDLAYVRNKKIGFVFQSFNLLARAHALSNVMLPFVYSDYPKAKRRERAMEVLESVGLADRWSHKPNELSGGQKQRVAIARALVNDPAIILADEPTGNIDSRSGLEIMILLQALNREGMTILCVTHDRFIAEHAEMIINLLDGKISRIEEVKERKDAREELQKLPKEEDIAQ
ncbi:MAG: ABC transporter ATP-binding protein [Proteobacteria bacterium]|nr:ABC transporter ATP-binding protein [Pseudomonadota bacterium]